jgi:hypothetical protein
MRRAFELAFATTYLFAGRRPSLVRVDEVTFRCVSSERLMLTHASVAVLAVML